MTKLLTDITDFIAIMSPSGAAVIFPFIDFDNEISPGTTAFEKNEYVLLYILIDFFDFNNQMFH